MQPRVFLHRKKLNPFAWITIEEENSILEKELPVAHQRIIYCHSDFQYINITIDEETNSITISVILFFFLLVI